jgi:hypothetical protein
MAHVVVRVELHGPTVEAQYTRLHAAMAAAGFSRTILGSDGASYQLPPAMYYADRFNEARDAQKAAWTAASGIAASYAVIATSGPSSWNGLRQV